MSHYLLHCIVPKKEIENNTYDRYISYQLAKYDESIRVKPYISNTNLELQIEFREWLSKNPDNVKWKNKSLTEWTKYWYSRDLDENGNLISTYNPDAKWDCWSFGGRWSLRYDNNMIQIQNYLPKLIKDYDNNHSFAILTIDQEWIENQYNDIDWKQKYLRCINLQNPDDYIVLIDCHI